MSIVKFSNLKTNLHQFKFFDVCQIKEKEWKEEEDRLSRFGVSLSTSKRREIRRWLRGKASCLVGLWSDKWAIQWTPEASRRSYWCLIYKPYRKTLSKCGLRQINRIKLIIFFCDYSLLSPHIEFGISLTHRPILWVH